jgi:glycosyltransferase involved in cell wall biosynthesis
VIYPPEDQIMKKFQPKITVVTPSFNQGRFIEETIESVAAQGFSNLEHLIMDGGSNDETLNILKRRSGASKWKHMKWASEPDSGQSAALNKGFQLATGEIIGWLNSDDRYRTGCFETVAQAFALHPEVDIFYGDYTVIDEAGGVIKTCNEIEFNPFVLRYHRVLYIPSTTTFFRRRIFMEENWLNEDLHYAMDAEFFIRLSEAGYRFKHIPALMADFRLHPESKSCSNTELMLQEREHITRAHSKILHRWQSPSLFRITLACMKTIAAAMRYSEKLSRGYYSAPESQELMNMSGIDVNS